MVRTGTLIAVLICFGVINLFSVMALMAAYPALPPGSAFRDANTFEPSVLWALVSAGAGLVAGLASGVLCWSLLGKRAPRIGLLIMVLVHTALVTKGTFNPGPQALDPAQSVRAGDPDFLAALQEGHTPIWVIGAGAVLGVAATVPLGVPSKRRESPAGSSGS